MLFTLLFIVIFFVDNKKKIYFNKKIDNQIEITIDDVNYNPTYSDDYWNKIYKELVYYSLRCIGILICVYFDICYVNYMYFKD